MYFSQSIVLIRLTKSIRNLNRFTLICERLSLRLYFLVDVFICLLYPTHPVK